MLVLKFFLVFAFVWIVQGVLNPKDVEYREKKIFVPTLEEIKTGKIKTIVFNLLVKNYFSLQFLKRL